MGTVYMESLDNPFTVMENLLDSLKPLIFLWIFMLKLPLKKGYRVVFF